MNKITKIYWILRKICFILMKEWFLTSKEKCAQKMKTWNKFLTLAATGLIASGAFAQEFRHANVHEAGIADAMAQTAGSNDTINLNYITSLGMQQKAWNDPMQHMGEGQLKPGYSRYLWTPDVVLPIRLREGMMTLINMPAWELIEKVHIGSPESFGGEIAAANSLLIYADPNYIGVDSNMIVFGRSGNRYVFYLRSETYNTDRITNSVVDIMVGPNYTPVSAGGSSYGSSDVSVSGVSGASGRGGAPGWAGKGNSLTAGGAQNPTFGLNTASNAPANWMEGIPVNPEDFRFDIDVFIPNPDDIELAPERVWRDEIFTYIDLGEKALTMTQRPIVNLIVQGSEVPVGSRARGPNSRLIVVEGVGDMIMKNGQRIICLKMRRDPRAGMEYADYSGSQKNNWYADKATNTAELPMGVGVVAGNGRVPGFSNPYETAAEAGVGTYSGNMMPLPDSVKNSAIANSGIADVMSTMNGAGGLGTSATAVPSYDDIAIELGTATSIAELEDKWQGIYAKNKDVLRGFSPYFSIDTAAEGGMPELFRLRIGPFKDVASGDVICSKLSKKGITCSVVRTQ